MRIGHVASSVTPTVFKNKLQTPVDSRTHAHVTHTRLSRSFLAASMSHDNKSGTASPFGFPHYAQTPSAPPYVGDKVSTAPPPAYTVTPVSVPVPTQTHYVRKINKFVYGLVWAGIVLCGVLCLGIASNVSVHNYFLRETEKDNAKTFIKNNPEKFNSNHDYSNDLDSIFFMAPLQMEPGYVNLLCNDEDYTFKKRSMLFQSVFQFYAFVAVIGFIQLLRAKMTTVYTNTRRNYAITLLILSLLTILGSIFKLFTAFSVVFCSLVFCPYFYVALGALRDLTGEKARRWLPVYYEAVTPDPKTAV